MIEPQKNTRYVSEEGRFTTQGWLLFRSLLDANATLEAQIAALEARLAALESE